MKTLHRYGNWSRIVLLSFFILVAATSAIGMSRFVSLEGRFSISLPDRFSLQKLIIPTPLGDAHGKQFEWQTKEGAFGVGYADTFQPIKPEAVKQFFDEAAERFRQLAGARADNI